MTATAPSSPVQGRGMLWFDDSKTTLIEKVDRAAGYFFEKYGIKADICCVATSALDSECVVNGIRVRPLSVIQPDHFWVGRAAE